MQSTAVLTLLDAHTAAGREAASPEAALATLPAVFAAVPDPRSRHGQRDDLPVLLTCLAAPHADGLALPPPAPAPRGGAPGRRPGRVGAPDAFATRP